MHRDGSPARLSCPYESSRSHNAPQRQDQFVATFLCTWFVTCSSGEAVCRPGRSKGSQARALLAQCSCRSAGVLPTHDPLNLSCMVDSAYSMADWSVQPSTTPVAPRRRRSPSPQRRPQAGSHDADLENETSAALAALDSMYTALSSLGFQQV